MPIYSDGWTPADQAASTAFAHAMEASKAQQTQAQRLRALEERVAALEDVIHRLVNSGG